MISDIYYKTKKTILTKIPTAITSGCHHYLTVTLGSWVTPQVITALVPLMTLWSCGGLVMRVRAVNKHRGCFSDPVFEQWTQEGLPDFHWMFFWNGVNHAVFPWVEYFARLWRTGNVNLCIENEYIYESLDNIVRISWQWSPGARYVSSSRS